MNDDRAGEKLRHELKLRIPGEVARESAMMWPNIERTRYREGSELCVRRLLSERVRLSRPNHQTGDPVLERHEPANSLAKTSRGGRAPHCGRSPAPENNPATIHDKPTHAPALPRCASRGKLKGGQIRRRR
jgi:hypothetical protein